MAILWSLSVDNLQTIAALLAGVLSILAFNCYVRDVLSGVAKPEKACWLIWSVLGAISFASQAYEGASPALIFVGVQVGATMLVASLSMRWGYGKFFTERNLWIFILASAGLLAWAATDNSANALAISIGISLLGGIRTIKKAFHDPDSESGRSWWMCFAASVFAVISVGALEPILLAYPLYLLVLYSSILIALNMGLARERWKQSSLCDPDGLTPA